MVQGRRQCSILNCESQTPISLIPKYCSSPISLTTHVVAFLVDNLNVHP